MGNAAAWRGAAPACFYQNVHDDTLRTPPRIVRQVHKSRAGADTPTHRPTAVELDADI